MATNYDKDDLFSDFFYATQEAMAEMEALFGIDGLYTQVLGSSDTSGQRQMLLTSPAWTTLCRLHDYALSGRLDGFEPQDIVIDGAKVLSLVTTENHRPEERWNHIVAMGDARFALDDGEAIELDNVALLAHVDVRTVRNAVSGGEMLATKQGGKQLIDNASARRWLAGRRGFKPTEVDGDTLALSMGDVTTPAQFATLLTRQRKQLGMDTGESKLVAVHPTATPAALAQLETGVFSLPLDAAFPLADFYQLPRNAFLACVMRVFFRAELDAIVGAPNKAVAP